MINEIIVLYALNLLPIYGEISNFRLDNGLISRIYVHYYRLILY